MYVLVICHRQIAEQIANGFVNFTENHNNRGTFFYRYFLNRELDNVGEAQLISEFIQSEEFIVQNDTTSFVNFLYFVNFCRKDDTAGQIL